MNIFLYLIRIGNFHLPINSSGLSNQQAKVKKETDGFFINERYFDH